MWVQANFCRAFKKSAGLSGRARRTPCPLRSACTTHALPHIARPAERRALCTSSGGQQPHGQRQPEERQPASHTSASSWSHVLLNLQEAQTEGLAK